MIKTQSNVQAISASHVAQQESVYKSEGDHDPLDLELLLNTESDNEWLGSWQNIQLQYLRNQWELTSQSKFKGTKPSVWQVSRYPGFFTAATKKFSIESNVDTRAWVKVSSADRSDLGPNRNSYMFNATWIMCI